MVEDTESRVISMVEVPVDHMEEDSVSEHRSFGDLNQGVVLDKSPIKQTHCSMFSCFVP